MLCNLDRNLKNPTEQKLEIHLIGHTGMHLMLLDCLGAKEIELQGMKIPAL